MKKILLFLLFSISSLIILVVVVFGILYFAIHHEGFQNRLKDIALSYLELRIHSKVELERISIRFPDKIVLRGMLIEDMQQDTLFAMQELVVDIDMKRLLDSEVVVQHISVEGLKANIYMLPDRNYNFEFITEAFVTTDPEPLHEDTSALKLTIQLNTILLNDVDLRFEDDSLMKANFFWKSLALKMGDIDLINEKYRIDKVVLKDATMKIRMLGAQMIKAGFNPDNIDIRRMNFNLSDLVYSADTVSVVVNSLSLLERSGLSLSQVSLGFTLLPKALIVNDFYLRTPHSKLQNTTILRFDSLAQLSSDLSKVDIQTRFEDSFAGIKDVVLLMPDLQLGEGMQLPPVVKADIDFKGSIAKFNAKLIVESDLAGFSLLADVSSIDPDSPAGVVSMQDIYFHSDSLNLELDDVKLIARSSGTKKSISLTLPFAQLLLEGDYRLTQLGNVANNLMVKYFNMFNASYLPESNQQFDLSLRLEDHPFLRDFLPDSLFFEPLNAHLSYHSGGKELELKASVPSLQMGGLMLGELNLNLFAKNDIVGYQTEVKEVKQDELEAPLMLLTGRLKHDVTDFALLLRDTVNMEDNRISGSLNLAPFKADGELPPLHLDLSVDRIALKSFEAFTTEYVTNSQGYFSGKVHVNDLMGAMSVTGALKFNDIAMKILMLDETFRIPSAELLLKEDALVFHQFEIIDEKEEKLTIGGQIGFTEFQDFRFDLRVKTDNFRALNSAAGSNDLFFGDLFLGVDLHITGNPDLPVVTGTLKVNDKSRLTFMVPQLNPSLTDRTGIVEFVTPGVENKALEIVPADSLTRSSVNGMDVGVNIVIDKNAELSMVIDKVTGDYVKLKGEALLSGGIDPSGKVSLTGRYKFHEGIYEMNVSLIQRKFAIREGSYIQWTGDPLTAQMDITAIYEVKTAPLSLVESRLVGVTPEMRNRYMQRLPFETELRVSGELTKPEVSFDIILADDDQLVSQEVIATTKAQLVQLRTEPAGLYKQVFALLLFNQFLAENPMHSASGGSTGLLIRESAGRIISQQLNQLAGKLIKGVEVEFDVNAIDDYSTGVRESRTDLNIALSRQLFDNRLKITVGSSFGLEGSPYENQSSSNIAGNFTADYLITRDGRYKLRAYRKNEYQMALLGEIVETGLKFMITMDYDTWSDLLSGK